jgi:pyroglutamyl-peptidase
LNHDTGVKTILLTGFGPFPGAPFNPTAALIGALMRRRRPAFAGVKFIGHVFQTSYAAVDHDLPSLVSRHRPAAIVMFGLATRTKHVRLERLARNRRSIVAPDAAGSAAPKAIIDPRRPAVLFGRVAFAALLQAARRSRVAAVYSFDAGRYLCNYAYWRAAVLMRDRGAKVIFIHVPLVACAPRRRRGRPRRIGHADLLRVGEAVLRQMIAEI